MPDVRSRDPGSTPQVVAAADPASIRQAIEFLRGGSIVAIPTDTVYGLSVIPREPWTSALISAKGRSAGKGLQLLIDGLDQVAALTNVPPAAGILAAQFWPGPLTIVLPLRPGIDAPEALTGGGRSLGVRVPDHVVPRTLARQLGPIAATSANRSGEPDALTAAAVVEAMGSSVALVLDDGPAALGRPSTVVAFDEDGGLEILREAAISAEQLIQALAR